MHNSRNFYSLKQILATSISLLMHIQYDTMKTLLNKKKYVYF